MIQYIIVSIVYLAFAVLFFQYKDSGKNKDMPKAVFYFLIAAAFAVRLWYAFGDYYFQTDISTFQAWGAYADSLGFENLYRQDIFLDYPPGYIYILYLLDEIFGFFNLQYYTPAANALFKMPGIIGDFACAFLIYKGAKRNIASDYTVKYLTVIFLFMPAVIFNSAVWGQVESWYIFFVALSIYLAVYEKTVSAAVCYAWAFITKPQALLFGPVLLFYIIKRKSVKEFFKAVSAGLISIFLFVQPCCKNPFDLMWLYDLYKSTFSGYKYFTVNAFNIYYLMDLNWAEMSAGRFASNINMIIIPLAVLLCGTVILLGRKNREFFTGGALLITVIFTFCTMMHERYIFPAALFLIMAYVFSGRKPFLAFALGFSTLNYLNISVVMAQFYKSLGSVKIFEKTVSLAFVILTLSFAGYLIYCVWAENKQTVKKYLNSKSALIAVTVLYSVFALVGLGNTKSVSTFYQAQNAGEYFTIEFKEDTDISSIYVYSGLGDEFSQPYGQKVCGEFDITYSLDGKEYYPLQTVNDLSVYTWKKYDVSAYARYVMVKASYAGAVLGEIVFCDSEGNTIYGQMKYERQTGQYGPWYAVDESHLCFKDTSYYNSMYFDEIYHARTAYEQLNGYSIYETTHPPLGKIIISIGIKLFGMTPFGWRIMGALCGILMIPIMYCLASLAVSKKWAVFASGILALDFMHLTQTRIATVDTYVVLFVMLTFLFMGYYCKTPFKNIKKEWLYLFLSGVFMGCAVSSKWNGAYPMIALAAVFFVILFTKYKNSPKEKQDKIYVIKTILICFVFFVLVPFIIYCLSYLPVINAQNLTDYLTQWWSWQKNMYDYHSNLEAEHFFSSMWYTWPLSIKPIWYAVSGIANGMVSTISAFGNPIIWILTPAASLYCLYKGVKEKNNIYLLISLGYIFSYIPWVFISRLCFIYHYFPCAVFGIWAIGISAKDIWDKFKYGKKAVIAFTVLAAVLFCIFIPVTTGWGAKISYVEFLEFLPTWYFY